MTSGVVLERGRTGKFGKSFPIFLLFRSRLPHLEREKKSTGKKVESNRINMEKNEAKSIVNNQNKALQKAKNES